ncbi:hypothetical protein ACI2KR_09335 [Pseudomonas luteola]
MTQYFREIQGNPLNPERAIQKSYVFVVNPCSNQGTWETTLANAISEIDSGPESSFKEWMTNQYYDDAKSGEQIPFELGCLQLVQAKKVPGLMVANLLMETNATPDIPKTLRYWAASKAMIELYQRISDSQAQGRIVEIHFAPRESTLHEGSWRIVKALASELAQESRVMTTFNL